MRASTLVLVALLASPLLGADGPKPWGASLGLASPQGDLKEFLGNKPGFKVGGAYNLGFDGGHQLRPRADYAYYKGTQESGGASADTKVQAIGAGVDYLYYPGGNPGSGFYLTAGLGFTHWKAEFAYGSTSTYGYRHQPLLASAAAAVQVKLEDSQDSADYGGGLGFQINDRASVELRYDSSEFDKNKDKGDRFQVVFHFRFGEAKRKS